MTERNRAMTALELLHSADCEFGAGDTRRGAGLLWQAVCAGLEATAIKRGLPEENLADPKAIVRLLDNGLSGYPVHLANFNVAEGFRDNAEEIYWSDIEIELARQAIRKYIHKLVRQ